MISEELKIIVRAEAANATRELKQLQGTTKQVSTNFKDIAKSLIGPLGVAAGVTLLTTKLVQGVKSNIQYAASMEKMSVAFEVMLGDAEKAEKVLDDIRQFSVSTPFEFRNLVPGAQRLIAFGTAAEDVVETMRDLGNASMGNQQSLDRLVLAYGKVQAKGKATLEELNMFTEAGVPIMKALQEQYGLTQEAMFEYVSTGKVGFEDVDKALQSLTRGEGQFAGMLERQSQTLEGAISTLTGAVQDLGGALAKDFLPYLTQVVQNIIGIVDAVNFKRSGASASYEVGQEGFLEYTTEAGTPERLAELRDKQKIAGRSLASAELLVGSTSGMDQAANRAAAALAREVLRRIEGEITGLMMSGVTLPGSTTNEIVGFGTPSNATNLTGFGQRLTIPNMYLSTMSDAAYGNLLANRAGMSGSQAQLLGGGGPLGGMLPWSPSMGSQFSGVGSGLASAPFLPYQNGGEGAPDKEEIDSLAGLMTSMESAMGSGAMKALGDTFANIGEALATGDAEAFGDALVNTIASVTKSLSEILLMGAFKAFADPKIPFEVGAGLLIAAGVTGIIGGAISGSMSVPSSKSTLGGGGSTGGTVYGAGNPINPQHTPTVVQNIQGSVWKTDELQSLAVTANKAVTSGR